MFAASEIFFHIIFIFKVLKTDKDKEEAKHEEETAEIMEKHSKELNDLGESFNEIHSFNLYKPY